MTPLDRFVRDRSGASELIGYALLVGIVFLAALLIVVYGSSLIQDAQNDVNRQSAQLVVQELDSKLSTLSSLSDVTRIRFDLGDTAPRDLRVVQEGVINVTVNRNVSQVSNRDCQTAVELTSVRYENERGRVVGYEAGGVWRGTANSGTTMVTAPDVTYQNGTVDVSVINISGRIDQNTNEAILDVKTSAALSERKTNRVLSGDCIRPDNVTLKVEGSVFYRAWGDYLENEFGHARTFDANRTAMTYLPQDELAEVANDRENNVVNLSQDNPPEYMTAGPGDGAAVNPDNSSYNSYPALIPDCTTSTPPGTDICDPRPANFTVDKGAGNTYTVQLRPLANTTEFSISNQTTVVQSLSETGIPSDVVFVIDRSGSMETCLDGSSPPCTDAQRIEAAQVAAAGSLNVLNESDRAGLVAYDSNGGDAGSDVYRSTDSSGTEQTLTTNAGGDLTTATSGVNESIDSITDSGCPYTAGCGTCVYCGLLNGLATFSSASNQSRNRSMVLLTDGVANTYGDATSDDFSDIIDLAEQAASRNITIHTVHIACSGLCSPGSNLRDSQQMMKRVARITGGNNLNTTDQEDLRDFFRQSLQTTVTTTQIRRTAATTNASTSNGLVFEPFVAGDTDDMGQAQGEFMNINDPMAPSTFRHQFAVQDGDPVYLNASWYGCESDGWQQTPMTENGYPVYRCVDPNENNIHNISDQNITIYTDGELVGVDTSGSTEPGGDPADWTGTYPPLLAEGAPSWQENMTQQLEGFLEEVTVGGDTEYRLNLSSNEAIVVYNYSVDDEDDALWNRMAMLYRIGLSEQEARPEEIINVRVRQVRLQDG